MEIFQLIIFNPLIHSSPRPRFVTLSPCHPGRRSPHSLYDGRLASQTNLEWFDSPWGEWANGFTSLWTLPSKLAADRQPKV